MGTLLSALDIGRSGLHAAQIQLDTAGHNIANVNTDGYSRQRVTLAARPGTEQNYGYLGAGVEVTAIERLREAFLDISYREQAAGLGYADVRAAYFSQMEDLLEEPGDNGFGTTLDVFFDSLNDFANNVEEQAVRMSVITEAQSLASSLNLMAERIDELRQNANHEIGDSATEINSITERIAALNESIRSMESGGKTANDLRDQRDLLLDQLAEQINITTRERDDGRVDVLVSGDMLINGGDCRTLETVPDPSIDPNHADFVRVQFADNGRPLQAADGRLAGARAARDQDLVELANRIDTIAATIILEINKIQSTGSGTEKLSGTILGTNAVTDSTADLAAAGLPFDVTAGSFDVVVYDSSGAPTTTTVAVTAGMTLDDLATALQSVPNFTASANADNTLSLGATGGNTFSFANDTSGVLTALGVNGLFTGHNAASIAVSQDIVDRPGRLTSTYSTDILDTGDNEAALAMADVRNQLLLDNGSATINDYYETTVVRVGVQASANAAIQDVQQAFVDNLDERRQEISGVSIDEEATNLILFQRAYEASARVITVADRMMDALLGMAR